MFLDTEGREIYRCAIDSLSPEKRYILEHCSGNRKTIARQIGVEPWIVRTYHEREQMKRDLAVGGLCLATMLIAAATCRYVGFPPGSHPSLEDRVVAPVNSRDF